VHKLTAIEVKENFLRQDFGGECEFNGFAFTPPRTCLPRKAVFQSFTNKVYVAGLFQGMKKILLKKIMKIKEMNKLDNSGQVTGKDFDIKHHIFDLMTEYLEWCLFEGQD